MLHLVEDKAPPGGIRLTTPRECYKGKVGTQTILFLHPSSAYVCHPSSRPTALINFLMKQCKPRQNEMYATRCRLARLELILAWSPTPPPSISVGEVWARQHLCNTAVAEFPCGAYAGRIYAELV